MTAVNMSVHRTHAATTSAISSAAPLEEWVRVSFSMAFPFDGLIAPRGDDDFVLSVVTFYTIAPLPRFGIFLRLTQVFALASTNPNVFRLVVLFPIGPFVPALHHPHLSIV